MIIRVISNIVRFYIEGFRSMTIGRTLWLIIVIKLLFMFVILKLFFFPNALSEYNSDVEKGDRVIQNLISNPR